MASILQDWVTELGLRHQGTLLTVIRGCDTAPKDDPSKLFARYLRYVLLNAHCGDARKAATFIEYVDAPEAYRRFRAFAKNCDHYPHHYVMHLVHSIEIIGYKHPVPAVREMFRDWYVLLCIGLHMTAETEDELDERLNASEDVFAANNRV